MPALTAGFAFKTLGIFAAGVVIAGSHFGSSLSHTYAERGAELLGTGVRNVARALPHAAAILGIGLDTAAEATDVAVAPLRPSAPFRSMVLAGPRPDGQAFAQLDHLPLGIAHARREESVRWQITEALEFGAEGPKEIAIVCRAPERAGVEAPRDLIRARRPSDRGRTVELEARLIERQPAELEKAADRRLRLRDERLVLELDCP